ncbi:MAG: ankyrin repeat domain-containing protein [Gammaproteobacteria bacterium]|nr:ankyrin repeat domain-containing protein [Gammaproteobacteria bacterium]
MLSRYFEIQENPFNLTPDPRLFYSNQMYREAYDKLYEVISERRGYMALTGETGAGKTTLLKTLMKNLDAGLHCVYFEYSNLTFEDFLELACNKLGLEAEAFSCGATLTSFLLEQSRTDTTVIFIIDEAQNMPVASLAQIERFTSSLSNQEYLLQVILSGQPQLAELLEQQELLALKNRLNSHYRLSPLPWEEVPNFISQQLSMVGNPIGNLLTHEAMQVVARYTKGRPRLINILCSRALVTAYAKSEKRISAEVMEETIHELRDEQGDMDSFLQKASQIQLSTDLTESPDEDTGPQDQQSLSWHEKQVARNKRFSLALLKSSKAAQHALRMGLSKLRESILATLRACRKPARDIWRGRIRLDLSGAIRASGIRFHLFKKQLKIWDYAESLGLGRVALIAVLIWFLGYPILKQKPEQAELLTQEQTAQITSSPIEPTQSLSAPPAKTPAKLTERQAPQGIDASHQTGRLELIEIAALEVATEPAHGKIPDSRQEPGSTFTEDSKLQAPPNTSTKVQVAADSTAKLEEFEKALLTTLERLEKTEAELTRNREKLEQARIRIENQQAQITTHLGQIDTLSRETNELKNRMVSFTEDQAPENIRDVHSSTPLKPLPRQDRTTANRAASNLPDPAFQIEPLLKRAAELITARHLTTPVGNNALEIYRQVLKIDPNNSLAMSGIESITQQYLVWAAQAKQENDWLNVENYYRKALSVDPSSSIAKAGLREFSKQSNQGSEKRASRAIDWAATETRNKAMQQLELWRIPLTEKALLISAEQGNLETVLMLLAAGILPDAKLAGGWTALMSAATHGHIEVVSALIDQGAEVNIRNYDGKTALMAAAWNGHSDIVRVLLSAGATIDEKNNEGWTALMYAAWNGHRKVVETLLEADASVAVKDANDWTAVTAASSEGHGEIVKILEMAGGS